MVDSPKQRTVRTSKAETCVSEMARREADRHGASLSCEWQLLCPPPVLPHDAASVFEIGGALNVSLLSGC